jgi:hypothetical protein
VSVLDLIVLIAALVAGGVLGSLLVVKLLHNKWGGTEDLIAKKLSEIMDQEEHLDSIKVKKELPLPGESKQQAYKEEDVATRKLMQLELELEALYTSLDVEALERAVEEGK